MIGLVRVWLESVAEKTLFFQSNVALYPPKGRAPYYFRYLLVLTSLCRVYPNKKRVEAAETQRIIKSCKLKGMELKEIKEILSENRIEDASWLCSLSESELDMLISLKLLVLQRAKIIGHEELANKFDLRTLRALGFILMEFFKGKVKDLALFPVSAEPAAFMDGCNLLKCDSEDIMSVEELKSCLDIDSRRPPKRRREEAYPNQKKRKC